VDSNTLIAGLLIPAARVHSSVRWPLTGFESLAWLQAWTVAANGAGAFAMGIANALDINNNTVLIHRAEAALDASAGSARRLVDALRGVIELDYSVGTVMEANNPNNADMLQSRFQDAGFATRLTDEVTSALDSAGLYALSFDTGVVTPAREVPAPNVTEPGLFWPSSEAETTAKITFSFRLLSATSEIQAVLLVLPEGFHHELHTMGDLVVTGSGSKSFPLATEEGSYVDTRQPGMLRIAVSLQRSIAAGSYEFTLPVYIPYIIPNMNIWYLCLCETRLCNSPTHPSVITAFSLPGFEHGEKHPNHVVASLAPPRRCIGAHVVVIIGAYLVALAAALGL